MLILIGVEAQRIGLLNASFESMEALDAQVESTISEITASGPIVSRLFFSQLY